MGIRWKFIKGFFVKKMFSDRTGFRSGGRMCRMMCQKCFRGVSKSHDGEGPANGGDVKKRRAGHCTPLSYVFFSGLGEYPIRPYQADIRLYCVVSWSVSPRLADASGRGA
jgi:hypothetical protein